MTTNLSIVLRTGNIITLQVEPNKTTIARIKELIQESIGIHPLEQLIVSQGKPLEDSMILNGNDIAKFQNVALPPAGDNSDVAIINHRLSPSLYLLSQRR